MTETLITRETAILGETIGYPFYTFPNVPTQSQVQKWLRDKHRLHITVNFELSMKWWYSVDRSPYDEFDDEISFILENFSEFETYESALESGIQYALTLVK